MNTDCSVSSSFWASLGLEPGENLFWNLAPISARATLQAEQSRINKLWRLVYRPDTETENWAGEGLTALQALRAMRALMPSAPLPAALREG